MAPQLLCLQLLLSLWGWGGTAASGSSPPAPAAVCMPGMTTAPFVLRQALPFCGGTLGSATCCTVEDDAKLHQAFTEDLKNHDYYGHDPHCTAAVKAIICAVCLPSAPADDDAFSSASNTTTTTNKNNSWLPLGCAGAATVTPSISTNDLGGSSSSGSGYSGSSSSSSSSSSGSSSSSSSSSSGSGYSGSSSSSSSSSGGGGYSSSSTSPTTQPPTPTPTTTPKWLIALLSVLATMLGGLGTYKICTARDNNQFCTNNGCCLCCH